MGCDAEINVDSAVFCDNLDQIVLDENFQSALAVRRSQTHYWPIDLDRKAGHTANRGHHHGENLPGRSNASCSCSHAGHQASSVLTPEFAPVARGCLNFEGDP